MFKHIVQDEDGDVKNVYADRNHRVTLPILDDKSGQQPDLSTPKKQGRKSKAQRLQEIKDKERAEDSDFTATESEIYAPPPGSVTPIAHHVTGDPDVHIPIQSQELGPDGGQVFLSPRRRRPRSSSSTAAATPVVVREDSEPTVVEEIEGDDTL